MADLKTFYKIKDIRAREKKEKQKQYQEQVEIFEEKAQQLYKVLKQKEEAERQFENCLRSGTVQAMSFIQHQHYLERLDQAIDDLQPQVHKARLGMQTSQEKLTDAYVEVKKFEKLIENKIEKQMFHLKQEENKHMDELSMTQYLNSQNR